MTVTDTSKNCPQCGELLPVARNYAKWCAACEWGLGKPDESRKGIFRSRVDRWSARQVKALFQQVSGSAVQRPGWGFARFASYALALCVHGAWIVLVAVGIWLIVAVSSIVTIILGLFALFLAFELRPRLGSFRKLKNVRRRGDAPHLFALLDQVAAEVGARPVHAVIADGNWNASYGAVGWRRRRVVTIGLPLWDALPADQKVAVLGHEFAHGVNGDARHGTIVGTSMATLFRVHEVLRPGRRLHARGRASLAESLANVIEGLLRSMVAGVLMAQQLISLRASQRAEYLADAISARVASPASMAGSLDTIVTGRSTYSWILGRRRFTPKAVIWDQLRSALPAVPESEKERCRREDARKRLTVIDTHPPAHLRMRMLRDLPASEASVSLSAAREEAINAELAQDYARVARQIDDAVGVALW
jgi:Zn-dependent protease with chaperone function